MSKQSLVVLGNVFIDRLQFRIVRQNVLAVTVLDFHAEGLPDFHGDGAILEIAIDLLDAVLGEGRCVELVSVECRAKEHVAMAGMHEGLPVHSAEPG